MVPLPTYVQMEPVGQCNLRCRMCPIQFRLDGPPHGPAAFMAFETFTRLIDQFKTLQDLHLQGLGEPSLHPRFFDMIRYAVARGVRVSTNSNFTLFTEQRAEELVRSGLDTVHISIDGATAETYEFIRVWGKLRRVLRNVRYLVRAKKKLGSETPHIRMVVVAMRKNLDEFPKLVRLANRLGIKSVFVQHLCHDFGESSLPAHYAPMRDFVQEQTLFEVSEDHVSSVFEEARREATELGVDLRLPEVRKRLHPRGTPGIKRCSWPWTGAYVSYQGMAMPCCMIATPDRFNFGNIARQGVEETWNGASYDAFRQQLDSEQPPEICRSCSIYSGTF